MLIDVTRDDSVAAAAGRIGTEAGRLDVLVTDPDRMESRYPTLAYGSAKAAVNMLTLQYAKAFPAIRVNAVDPGYTATDLNAHRGTQTIEEGAEVIVAMAEAGPDGPTGGYFDRKGPVPW